MNFCGTDQRFVYDDVYDGIPTRKMPSPDPEFTCGACTKVDSVDEDVPFPSVRNGQLEHPMKAALDNIQQTLEESAEIDRVAVDCFVPQTPPRPQRNGHQRNASLFSTPSPTLLNPISSRWNVAVANEEAVELCPMPTLSSGSLQAAPSGLDVLLRRLEEGFSVQLISGPSSCLSVGDMHSICAHWDRSCLYLKTSLQHKAAGDRREDLDCWIELPIEKIARLEYGGREKSSKSFTLVLDKYGEPVYYDFEAGSSVDREIIVTAILLLLDGGGDGTIEQPIPCSPSLDQYPTQSRSCDSHALSSKQSREDWTSVIHAEDLEAAAKHVVEQDAEELRLDFKPSASSVNLGAVNSTQMTWCPADSCTLALNDIADTCTGIFAMKQSGNVVPQQGAIEEFIATALGAPTAVYTYLAMPEVWASQGEHGSFDRSAPAQNRASVLNAQAARLRNLRNEMTFAAALKQSKDPSQYVQTAHSFDGAGNSKPRLNMATKAADVLHTSPLLHSIVGNMDVYENRQDVDACYYDSDPEDYRPRTEKPRKAAAEEFEAAATDEHEKRALNSIDFERIGSQNRISRKVDDETISDIVHAVTNERLTLMWHPTQTTQKRNRSPICVKVWIETGVYLNDGTFLLPKLNWSRASHPEVLGKLDLLDICRIRHVSHVDRLQHPFALTRRSFYIETQTDVFVFQAHTPEERDRIVYCLKVVVARLASLLMLRDIRAAEEFFGAVNSQVPGEAPCWTQKNERG